MSRIAEEDEGVGEVVIEGGVERSGSMMRQKGEVAIGLDRYWSIWIWTGKGT